MSKSLEKKRRIGRYEILDEIGRGGMAVVYRALDTNLKREIALKLLHPHLASNAEAKIRFEREAHAVARVHHKSIVEVYDFSSETDDEVFLTMELIEGTTLRKFLDNQDEKVLPAEAAALIARQVLAAVASAHEHGIVHRDVKPENILISTEGAIKLSDFGIAQLAGLDQMTVTGQILGSPAYMSPEHIEMADLDSRADIFSVGILLYEMTVGSLPFHGNNPHQIIKRIIEGYYDHPLSVQPSIGHAISSVIMRCMQQSMEQRYDNATTAMEELDQALAAMNMGPLESELAAFFKDPKQWEENKRPEIIRRTLALGNSARKKGRLPEAMDHFNRVLSLSPGNEQALDAVSGLSRRRRFRRGLERVFVAVVAVLIIAGSIWGVLIFQKKFQDELKNEETVSTDESHTGHGIADNPQVETPKMVVFKKEVEEPKKIIISQKKVPELDTEPKVPLKIKPIRRGGVVHAKQAAKTKKTKRKVIFNPLPMGVDVVIDNNEKFTFKSYDRMRVLTEGEHTITFIPKDNRRMAVTKKITVVKGETAMTVGARLKWKPARVKISTNVKATVSVAGLPSKPSGLFFEVPFKKESSKIIRVLVSASGYQSVTKQVSISAGKTTEVLVSLKKIQQNP